MHIPVLSNELFNALNLKEGGTAVDSTVNGGGHGIKACDAVGESGTVIGIDLDADALKIAKEKLDGTKCKVILEQANFRDLDKVLLNQGILGIDAAFFDLGMSSDQLEASGRGFSFQKDEPLLMTFKSEPSDEDLTAREIVNNWSEDNIADIIYSYGEERFARRIARAIAEERKRKPLEKTGELVAVIEKAVPKRYKSGRIHPATRTFQALRITVNDEIQSLKEGLKKTFNALNKGGRIAVITFHSIEDRTVKRFFNNLNKDGKGTVVTKKPIVPSDEEIEKNPRARSAKLRVFQKSC